MRLSFGNWLLSKINKTTEKLGCLFKKHNVRTGDGDDDAEPSTYNVNKPTYTRTKKGIGSSLSSLYVGGS